MFKLDTIGKIGILASIVTILLGLISLGTYIESHIEKITTNQTTIIAGLMANDLRTRLNLYESYVVELKNENKLVPVLLIYNIKALNDQLTELKEWDDEI